VKDRPKPLSCSSFGCRRFRGRRHWFYPDAILDSRSGGLERFAGDLEVDMVTGGWGPNGHVMTLSMFFRSDLWRLTPAPAKP
jgi:hypothetical protein